MRQQAIRNPKLAVGAVVALALAALVGCGGGGGEAEAPGAFVMSQNAYEEWEIGLVEMRILKNDEFADPARSPLREADVPGFEALDYYFPRADLRFRTPFLAEAGSDTVMLAKRKGGEVPYIRRGRVRFRHDGRVHELPVFGPANTSAGNYLWLPFTDLTTGKETYAGGRYLDIELDADGMVDLDFNFAYNPLCMYNAEKWNCTLPPAESHLDFAVEAGEKIWAGGAGH
ncbi:DUF1684 domain-containing protein [bacterium]|nr:DUF1684 domain-containing protein [bacterium]